MAPAQLLFGNLIHLVRGILLPNLPATRDDKEFKLSAWAARVVENQRILPDIAQKRQLARDAGHMAASPDKLRGFGGGQTPYQTPYSSDGTLWDSE